MNLASSTSVIAPVYTSPLLTAGTPHDRGQGRQRQPSSIDDFIVGPATPTLAWATPADLTFGTALDGTELDAFVSNFAGFPGTFTYSPPAGTVLPVGQNQPLTVTFTPTDTANYDSASAEVLINVAKATPVITWTGPDTDMTFGQALGPAQLNATATVNGTTVPGTFVYTPAAGTVPPTGQNFPLSVTFTPDRHRRLQHRDGRAGRRRRPGHAGHHLAQPRRHHRRRAADLDAAQRHRERPRHLHLLAAGRDRAGARPAPGPGCRVHSDRRDGLQRRRRRPPSSTSTTARRPSSPSCSSRAPPRAARPSARRHGRRGGFGRQHAPERHVHGHADPNGGTFAGGGNAVTAPAVNGVATFSTLAITTNGKYTLTASDGSLADRRLQHVHDRRDRLRQLQHRGDQLHDASSPPTTPARPAAPA